MNEWFLQLQNSIPELLTITKITAAGAGTGYTIHLLIDIKRSLKIKKENKQKNWTLYKRVPDISGQKYETHVYAEFNKENLQKLNSILNEMSYPAELAEIVEQFKNYVTTENFKACFKRLQTVKINKIILEKDIKAFIDNLLSLQPAAGTYSPMHNTINLYYPKKNVLSHEFLHMASTQDGLNHGFAKEVIVNNRPATIGRGFNEGYTELLNHRIFGSKNSSYYHNVKMARLFEIFFDNPKDMENSYFHSDLNSLYEMFCEYGTKEEFFKIMNNLDDLATTKIPIYNTITSVQTQLKLYDIIKRSKNKDKISAFEQILDENPLTKLLRNGQNLVLANKPPKIIKTK